MDLSTETRLQIKGFIQLKGCGDINLELIEAVKKAFSLPYEEAYKIILETYFKNGWEVSIDCSHTLTPSSVPVLTKTSSTYIGIWTKR